VTAAAGAAAFSPPPHSVAVLPFINMSGDKLGRRADAEAALAKLTAAFPEAPAYQCAEIYAQWGNRAKALEWLEEALQVRDPDLALLKVDPFLDPLRNEPRLQTILRTLKFPN
jgi:hypothetical protein